MEEKNRIKSLISGILGCNYINYKIISAFSNHLLNKKALALQDDKTIGIIKVKYPTSYHKTLLLLNITTITLKVTEYGPTVSEDIFRKDCEKKSKLQTIFKS